MSDTVLEKEFSFYFIQFVIFVLSACFGHGYQKVTVASDLLSVENFKKHNFRYLK